jgi:hypothetical protein
VTIPFALFPDLLSSSFFITSPTSPKYNCVAWAAEDVNNWWWPDDQGVGHWPKGVPRDETLEAFVQAFATLGYAVCNERALEPGWQKVALYALAGKPTHVSRQLANGRWTSKLGPREDLEHDFGSLDGPLYGAAVQVMKRPVPSA